jgi:hypothetical protein
MDPALVKDQPERRAIWGGAGGGSRNKTDFDAEGRRERERKGGTRPPNLGMRGLTWGLKTHPFLCLCDLPRLRTRERHRPARAQEDHGRAVALAGRDHLPPRRQQDGLDPWRNPWFSQCGIGLSGPTCEAARRRSGIPSFACRRARRRSPADAGVSIARRRVDRVGGGLLPRIYTAARDRDARAGRRSTPQRVPTGSRSRRRRRRCGSAAESVSVTYRPTRWTRECAAGHWRIPPSRTISTQGSTGGVGQIV